MRAPARLANIEPPPRKPEDAEPLRATNAQRVRPEMDEDRLARVRLRTQLSLPVYRQREQPLSPFRPSRKRNGAGPTSSVERVPSPERPRLEPSLEHPRQCPPKRLGHPQTS